jgi:hypothetical protein
LPQRGKKVFPLLSLAQAKIALRGDFCPRSLREAQTPFLSAFDGQAVVTAPSMAPPFGRIGFQKPLEQTPTFGLIDIFKNIETSIDFFI